MIERFFSPSPTRRGRAVPRVCTCPEGEIRKLSAAMELRNSPGREQREQAKRTDAVLRRGTQETGECREKQEPGRRKGRLVASLERAARRRLNGALGDSRAPAHYQAILPAKGIREQEWRLWRFETGSQLRSPGSGGTPERCQGGTPWSSSVDTLTSPGQPET